MCYYSISIVFNLHVFYARFARYMRLYSSGGFINFFCSLSLSLSI